MKLLVLMFPLAAVAATVPTVTIHPNVKMPMMAFGSANSSFKGQCTVQEAIEQWLSLGGRHVDAASDYGTQPDVGRALKATSVPRKEIFVTTKIPGPIGAEAAINVSNTALVQLGVEYIDLVLIHFPCPAMISMNYTFGPCPDKKPERLDTYKGLRQMREQGKIRAIGVSNYHDFQLEEIKAEFSEVPAVNQIQYHLGYHNDTLVKYAQAMGTVVAAWASLGGPTAAWASTPSVSLGDARLKQVASRYNKSTAQIAFRWETQKGVVPVTATCNKDHVMGDLEAFSFKLSDADMSYLDTLMPKNTSVLLV